jgi:hypothetical protein
MPGLVKALTVLALVLGAGAARPAVAAALDSEPWDRVLRAHARQGGVDYAGLSADPAARRDLSAFVAALGEMDDDEPLASWLNAYNALVVSSVVEHHPVRSVRDIDGFFDRIGHRVAGRVRTLDQIEHEVIRVRFRDARVHVALNCGALSCPGLHPRAFRTSGLARTLDRLARNVVVDARHVHVRNGRVRVSQIFHWFAADFERDAGSVLGWLRRYDTGARLGNVPADAELGTLDYDWRLNDRPCRRRIASASDRPCAL